MMEARRALSQQIFQLSYFGKISAEYVSGLEVSERNFIYKLLKDQLDAEKKQIEKGNKQTTASTASMRSQINRIKKR